MTNNAMESSLLSKRIISALLVLFGAIIPLVFCLQGKLNILVYVTIILCTGVLLFYVLSSKGSSTHTFSKWLAISIIGYFLFVMPSRLLFTYIEGNFPTLFNDIVSFIIPLALAYYFSRQSKKLSIDRRISVYSVICAIILLELPVRIVAFSECIGSLPAFFFYIMGALSGWLLCYKKKSIAYSVTALFAILIILHGTSVLF
jgi:hypothetical protein